MPISSLFKKNSGFKPKAGAVILALFLWLYVALSQTFTDDIDFKVAPVNIIQGKTVANKLPDKVLVSVTGKGIDLLWLHLFWKSELRIELDFGGIQRYLALNMSDNKYLDDLKLPRGFETLLKVQNIVSPDTITVVIEDLVTRKIPVNDKNIKIIPEVGYIVVGNLRFEPDSVSVSGAKSQVEEILYIFTEVKSFSGKKKDFSEVIKLENNQDILYGISVREVSFSADIQKIGEVVIPNISVQINGRPASRMVEIIPSIIDVTLTGGADFLSELKPEDITAVVEFERSWERWGRYNAEVSIIAPEGILSYKISPGNIEVEVK